MFHRGDFGDSLGVNHPSTRYFRFFGAENTPKRTEFSDKHHNLRFKFHQLWHLFGKVHTYIHTYIQTYRHTDMHAYVRTYHPCIPNIPCIPCIPNIPCIQCIHAYIQTYRHTYIYIFSHIIYIYSNINPWQYTPFWCWNFEKKHQTLAVRSSGVLVSWCTSPVAQRCHILLRCDRGLLMIGITKWVVVLWKINYKSPFLTGKSTINGHFQ